MNEHWLIETHGKPLQTVQNILTEVWHELEIQSMLLPLKNQQNNEWEPTIITSPDHLDNANPFTPLMPENVARRIPAFLTERPDKISAVLLRPCEIRAAHFLREKSDLAFENLIMISTDCLGTFPSSEYSWRVERKGKKDLSEEALQFSRQGGIVPYRYRTACQLCVQQTATQADINIHIVGLPVRSYLLISVSGKVSDQLSTLFNGRKKFNQELFDQHISVSERMLFRNRSTHSRLSWSMVEETNLDLELLLRQLNNCGPCQSCIESCPICSCLQITRDTDGNLSRELVAEWMIACVGCGICEQNCVQHKPLAAIFSIVKEQLLTLEESST
jgi:formate dehydrogenase subunit beta